LLDANLNNNRRGGKFRGTLSLRHFFSAPCENKQSAGNGKKGQRRPKRSLNEKFSNAGALQLARGTFIPRERAIT
jgi:hypothetical protein